MDKIFLQELFHYLKRYQKTFFYFQDIELIYEKIYHKEMTNYFKLVCTEELLEDAHFCRTYINKNNKINTVFRVTQII
ncbi:hypothetical protein BH747_09300 [Enterococcus villorum]|uniref:Uncharacterized protein n=1 Tax=Enterococcus villorum TaxID=112904 RepID=A0A1V8YAY3_9ENTE|nr:hypothetical protein [Enterococcus villorum]OQO69745.1 hypothetical protein BH747_09300 [Enterococcus villorum]